MWVAMEATTLASAPLLYFNHNARSLEATWKYLLIGSVGIALALFGSFFLAYAIAEAGLESTLLFDQLIEDAPHLSPPWLHAAFVLLFVGYGTKMGLAPMHTWKPDAYGEAPGMVGTLLAGGVTSCAFLAILRVYQICRAGAEAEFAREIMIFMGLLSMAVAAVFMVRQRDFKRMLAYSSVEHMGILVLGIGIGGLAVYGALLHLINNGLTKGVLFLSAGNIHRAYGSKLTDDVRGAHPARAALGALFLAGFLAITGSPPFGPFVSEFTIVNAAVGSGQFVVGGLFLLLLGIVFIGMGATVLAVVQGKPAEPKRSQRLSRQRRAPAARSPLHGARAAAGPLHPAAAGVAAARGRRVPGGEAMSDNGFAALRNGQAIRAHGRSRSCPSRSFARTIVDAVAGGQRVAALFGDAAGSSGEVDLLRRPRRSARGLLHVGQDDAGSDRFPSLTPDCPQVHLFEREIAEQYGVCPEGHPWLKPVRFHASYRPGHDAWGRSAGEAPVIGVTDFYRVEGRGDPRGGGRARPRRHHRAGPFPLPVPRRTGLPPGDLARLSASRASSGPWSAARPSGRSTRWRRVAGDTTVGHATAYCQALEALAGCRFPSAPRCCAASPWSWSGWPTTPATWRRWPATSGSCRPRPTAAGSAATSST